MPPGGKPPPAGRLVGRSRSLNDKNGGAVEESIYNMGAQGLSPGAAPKIKTYEVPVASPPPGSAGGPKPRMHADSSQVSSILHPVHGVREAQVRRGEKPFNHARSNVAAVKEASQLNALRRTAAQQQGVLEGGVLRPANAARSTSAPMRRPTPTGGGSGSSRRSDGYDDNNNYGIDGLGAESPSPNGGGRDFLRENRVGAAAAPARQVVKPDKQDDDGSKYLAKRDYGRVPTYLLERKLELAEAAEAAARAKEAALIPPGMRLLPEEERQETLALLAKNRAEVDRAIQGLPIIIETPSAKRRQAELEARLREIEDALKVFSRPKVLVQL